MNVSKSSKGWLFFFATTLLFAISAAAQSKHDLERPVPIEPAEGKKLARALVGNLLALRPSEDLTQRVTFKIMKDEDREDQVPVEFRVVSTPTNFLNIYETLDAQKSSPGMKLTITHAEGQPNQYSVSQPPGTPSKNLTTSQSILPFAGSDFWAADLGLEFLHWPEQRVTRKQMRKSVFCEVLESINPAPGPGGYSKVVSWIGANRPDEMVIVHADAFDSNGKLLKQFDPRKLEKVNGSYQLAEMEIRNRQTGTRTKVEFELRSEVR